MRHWIAGGLFALALVVIAVSWRYAVGPYAKCRIAVGVGQVEKRFDLFYEGQNFLRLTPDPDPRFSIGCELLSDEKGRKVQCVSVFTPCQGQEIANCSSPPEVRVREAHRAGDPGELVLEDTFGGVRHRVACGW